MNTVFNILKDEELEQIEIRMNKIRHEIKIANNSLENDNLTDFAANALDDYLFDLYNDLDTLYVQYERLLEYNEQDYKQDYLYDLYKEKY